MMCSPYYVLYFNSQNVNKKRGYKATLVKPTEEKHKVLSCLPVCDLLVITKCVSPV